MDISDLKAAAQSKVPGARKAHKILFDEGFEKQENKMSSVTIFDVMKILEQHKIKFRLARDRPDSIRVDATLYGIRLEVECFDDNHIEVSTFRGDEDIDGEYDFLMKVLSENSMD